MGKTAGRSWSSDATTDFLVPRVSGELGQRRKENQKNKDSPQQHRFFNFGLSAEEVESLYQPGRYVLDKDPSRLEEIHENTDIALQWVGTYDPAEGSRLRHVDLYTDGSYVRDEKKKEHFATWAFVAIGLDENNERQFLGYIGGEVDETLGDLVSDLGSQQAEGAAAVAAILWWLGEKSTLNKGVAQEITMCMHVHNLAIQKAIIGEGNLNKDTDLVKVMRGLMQLTGQETTATSQWVKAHATLGTNLRTQWQSICSNNPGRGSSNQITLLGKSGNREH